MWRSFSASPRRSTLPPTMALTTVSSCVSASSPASAAGFSVARCCFFGSFAELVGGLTASRRSSPCATGHTAKVTAAIKIVSGIFRMGSSFNCGIGFPARREISDGLGSPSYKSRVHGTDALTFRLADRDKAHGDGDRFVAIFAVGIGLKNQQFLVVIVPHGRGLVGHSWRRKEQKDCRVRRPGGLRAEAKQFLDILNPFGAGVCLGGTTHEKIPDFAGAQMIA